MDGGCLFSRVLVQGLYQLICSAALPQNLSGSATEAAKWVLYSPPPDDNAREPRAPRAPRGPGATKALRAAPAPRAEADPGRGPPSPPAPVTLRHCSQDGFIPPTDPRVLPAPRSSRAPGHRPPGDLWAAGSHPEAGANAEVCPEPRSLEVTLESPGKTDLEPPGTHRLEWGPGVAQGWDGGTGQ